MVLMHGGAPFISHLLSFPEYPDVVFFVDPPEILPQELGGILTLVEADLSYTSAKGGGAIPTAMIINLPKLGLFTPYYKEELSGKLREVLLFFGGSSRNKKRRTPDRGPKKRYTQ